MCHFRKKEVRLYQDVSMVNVISLELEEAKKKMIEEVCFQGKTLAKLTRDNVAIVEAMIRNDSAYIHSTDIHLLDGKDLLWVSLLQWFLKH